MNMNMNMKKFKFLLILTIIFFSCSKGRKSIDETINSNYKKTEQLSSIEEKLMDTTIFKGFSVVPLETTNESFFRKIDRVCINKDRIYIFDNSLKKVIIFDEKGKYITQIHNIGQGPKEYISTIDFCLDEKNSEIILLCDRPYKFIRFTKDGEFINEKTFTGLILSITVDSDYFFCETFESKNYEIGCFDKEFNIIYNRLLKLDNNTNTCYSFGNQLVKSKNIYYSRHFDTSLYYLSKDGIEKKYEFNFGKYKLPMNLSSENDCEKLFKICNENHYIYSITNVVESERYILFSTNIALCLYDKQTNDLKAYKMLYNPSIIYGSSVYYPNEGSSNSIITSFQPVDLAYYNEETVKDNMELKNLKNSIKEDDNPILIIYYFKE